MDAFTVGNFSRARQIAFEKKLMMPRFTSYFFLNFSAYFSRILLTAVISTSLKVVSMAVEFLEYTNRSEIVLRKRLIFSTLSFLLKVALVSLTTSFVSGACVLLSLSPSEGVTFSAGVFSAANLFLIEFTASSFVILPETPVPFTSLD